jgi:hypothetical protein
MPGCECFSFRGQFVSSNLLPGLCDTQSLKRVRAPVSFPDVALPLAQICRLSLHFSKVTDEQGCDLGAFHDAVCLPLMTWSRFTQKKVDWD